MGAAASGRKQQEPRVEESAPIHDLLDADARLVRLAQSEKAQILHWLPPNSGAVACCICSDPTAEPSLSLSLLSSLSPFQRKMIRVYNSHDDRVSAIFLCFSER